MSYNKRATWLLVVTAVLLPAAFPYRQTWVGGLVTHAAMAALVGGLADWYALKALFGRPLGIRWRTDWIARSQPRIVAWGRQMVVGELLTARHLYRMVQRCAPAETLAAHLAAEWPRRREQVIRQAAVWMARFGPPRRTAWTASAGTPAANRLASLCRALADEVTAADVQALSTVWTSLLRSDAARDAVTDIVRRWWEAERRQHPWRYHLWTANGRTAETVAASVLARIEAYGAAALASPQAVRGVRCRLLRRARKWERDARRRERADDIVSRIGVDWPAVLPEVWTPTACEPIVRGLLESVEAQVRRLWQAPHRRRQAERMLMGTAARLLPRLRNALGDAVERELSRISGAQMADMAAAKVAADAAMIRITGTVIGGVLGAIFFVLSWWLRGGAFHA